MPEGPEIRRAADRVEAAVKGQPLREVWFARPVLDAYSPVLTGSRVSAVKTRGKAMLTEFECGLTVYSHNQLYGRWYVVGTGTRPRTNRQLRWLIEAEEKSALLYSASTIEIMESAVVDRHPFLSRLGIDILADRPGVTELAHHLRDLPFERRTLGSLLLDQGFIAGTGNYLRSEILFAARLHPLVRLGDLDGHGRRRLARAAIEITERAYETGGLTNDPAIVRRLKQAGLTRRRYRHFVFGRAGQPCHRCGSPIEQSTVAGRRLYRCPRAQPEP